MINLSQNQSKILESIKCEIKLKGYPPSVREICGITGIKSTSTVHFHMNKLEKLGLIKRDPTKPRAIEILEEENFGPGLNQEVIELSIIEFFKDGLEITEKISETIKLPYSLVLGKDNFIYRVMDNKLIGMGVLKNDYITVDRTNRVDNGKLVIGISNNEVILGKYFKNKDNTVLQFANSFYNPLILENNKFKVVGQIKGYFRIIK